jgi:hypothetical protein
MLSTRGPSLRGRRGQTGGCRGVLLHDEPGLPPARSTTELFVGELLGLRPVHELRAHLVSRLVQHLQDHSTWALLDDSYADAVEHLIVSERRALDVVVVLHGQIEGVKPLAWTGSF